MSVDDVPAERREYESSDAGAQQHKANQARSASVERNPCRQDDADADDEERRRGKTNKANSLGRLDIQFVVSWGDRHALPSQARHGRGRCKVEGPEHEMTCPTVPCLSRDSDGRRKRLGHSRWLAPGPPARM